MNSAVPKKVSIGKQLQAIAAAERFMRGGPSPRPAERAMIAADLAAAAETLQWVDRNAAAIKASLGSGSPS